MNERAHLEVWSAAFFLAALGVGLVLALPSSPRTLVGGESRPAAALDPIQIQGGSPKPARGSQP